MKKRGIGMLRSVGLLATAFMSAPVWAGINTWTGGGPEGGIAWSVEYVSSQPGTAVAISGQAIYRTTNDGASWAAVGTMVPDSVRVVVAAGNPDRVYAVGNNQIPQRSDDGGATFTRITRFGTSEQNYESAFGLSADGNLAYGGTTGGEIHVSTDHGATWVKRSDGLGTESIAHIAVDPTDSAHAYAVSRTGVDGALYVTSNAGVSWTRLPGVCDNGCFSISIDEANPQRLLVAASGGLYLSVDGGSTWSFPQSGGFAVVRFDPSVAGRAFAVSSEPLPAVFRSSDGGQTWAQVGSLWGRGYVSSISIEPGTNRLMVTSAEGVHWSDDAGVTWQTRSAGIRGADLTQILAFEDGSNRVLAVGGHLGPAGVHERAASGDAWSLLSRPSSFVLEIDKVAYDPSNRNVLYGGGRGIFRSLDAGVTWSPLDANASSPWVDAIAVDPYSPQTIYVARYPQLTRSTDGGLSWNPIGTGFPTGTISALAIDRTDTRNLYAARRYDSDTPIFRSVDGGANWAPASTGILPSGVYNVRIDPRNGAIAYAATTTGLYRTANAGASWSRLPGNEFAHDVTIDPVITTNIVRTEYGPGLGVARSVDSGQTWDVATRLEPGLIRLVALDPTRPSNVIGAVDRFGAAEFEFATDLALATSTQSTDLVAGTDAVLSMTNRGPFAASGIRLQITMPDSASNASATTTGGSCTRAATTVTCEIGVLRNGENVTVTLANLAGVRAGEQINARISLHERDVQESNNTVALTVTGAAAGPPTSNPPTTTPPPATSPTPNPVASTQFTPSNGGGGSMGFGLLAALLALCGMTAGRASKVAPPR